MTLNTPTADSPFPRDVQNGEPVATPLKIGPLSLSTTTPETIARIVSMINAAYRIGEKGIWKEPWSRTGDAQIAAYIGKGELIAAYQDSILVGIMRFIHRTGPDYVLGSKDPIVVGEFGLLAVSAELKGTGAGRKLVAYAEEETRKAGIKVMQLEMLIPKHPGGPNREFLLSWYGRMGFKRVGLGQFSVDTGNSMEADCDFAVFQKAV